MLLNKYIMSQYLVQLWEPRLSALFNGPYFIFYAGINIIYSKYHKSFHSFKQILSSFSLPWSLIFPIHVTHFPTIISIISIEICTECIYKIVYVVHNFSPCGNVCIICICLSYFLMLSYISSGMDS